MGFVALVLGLFGVPIALLMYGHKLQRRTPRERGAFWGALVGHCVAATLALVMGMIPPEAWTSEETVRGVAGLWGLLLLPMAGGVVGAARSVKRQRAESPAESRGSLRDAPLLDQ